LLQSITQFYRIGKLLGKGAFGKVNSAMHKLSGKLVAVKSINKEYLTDENSKKKVMQEFSFLKLMRHPSVIRLYETFESVKHVLFVIELCVGGDLLSYVRKRKKLTEPIAKKIFKHLIDGLFYCHSKRVLHRDIKLDNILLNVDGHIKICDFGVSKLVKEKEIMTEQCGTPAYIAPEILRGHGYEGFAVDIWSAGAVLFAMLYGTVPFKANNMKDLHKMIMKGRYVLKDGISNNAKTLLSALLEINPKKRITIPEIYKHDWMKDVNEKLELFSKEEKEAIKKENCYERKGSNDIFTEQKIDSTINELTKNITTKSVILAPFNSTRSNVAEGNNHLKMLTKDKKEIIKFEAKVRDVDRQYEINNNGEIDNGVYNKLMYGTSESQNMSMENSDSPSQSDNNSSVLMNSLYSERENPIPLDYYKMIPPEPQEARNFFNKIINERIVDDNVVKKVEIFGFPRKYILKSLKNRELNYATTTYYLLLNK
jgi:serine/threonine protein kinase